ncbi:MAG: hypothetical protein LBG93_08485 [Treponema sp.]|jgi:hypothetical protein|nr:hypothetical protein [Treponema sp.]
MNTVSSDYFLQNAAQFKTFMQNFMCYMGNKIEEWNHIPAEATKRLSEKYQAFEPVFNAAAEAQTPAHILALCAAQTEVKKALKPLVSDYLYFPPVTNTDRINMGITNGHYGHSKCVSSA